VVKEAISLRSFNQIGGGLFLGPLHKCCRKFPSEAYKGGGAYVLNNSYPLCCGFLPLFPMSMFAIINSLLGGRETCKVVCL
jgi:hypothetical protein